MLLLFTLLAIDIAFMGLHTLKSLDFLHNPNFSVTKSFGYAETFQYLKAGFLAVFFIVLGIRSGRPQLYCWALIFTYILLDDSLELHEYFGYQLSAFFEQNIPMIGLGKSAGEILAFGIFGLLVFAPLFYFYFVSKNRSTKIATQDVFILFCGVIFFGVGFDLLHDFATTGTFLNGFLGLMEDGGEMLIMSIIIWYVWSFAVEEALIRVPENSGRMKTSPKKAPTSSPVLADRAAAISSTLQKRKSRIQK